jgi:hypothetical protein
MNTKALYRCTKPRCGHEQLVTEIHTEDGAIYAGSGANWCDKCNTGKPERVANPHEGQPQSIQPDSPPQNSWRTLVFPPTGSGKSFYQPAQFTRTDAPN